MATQDPVALLEKLCQEPKETPWLEFKVNNVDPDMLGQLISACANSAILADKPRGFIVFGIENLTKKKIGTSVVLGSIKKVMKTWRIGWAGWLNPAL